MTRKQAKKEFNLYRNEHYYEEIWLDSVIDWIYDKYEARKMLLSTQDLCNDECKHCLSDNDKFPVEPCSECTRLYADKFERKENQLSNKLEIKTCSET